MAGKTLSYIIAAIGIIVIALSYPVIRNSVGLSFTGIKDIYIMLAGLIIAIIGIFLAYKKQTPQMSEVPIYEGEGKNRKIVAYRRMKK